MRKERVKGSLGFIFGVYWRCVAFYLLDSEVTVDMTVMEVKRVMNSKTKLLAVMLASIAVCMVIVFPLTHAVKSSAKLGEELALTELEDCNPEALKVGVALWFLNNSEPVEVEGTVVTHKEGMLILDVGTEQTRMHLPEEWTVDGEIQSREELYSGGYLAEGETITVKALRADLIDREILSIYLMVGYEIIDDAGVHAYANLPVNIEA